MWPGEVVSKKLTFDIRGVIQYNEHYGACGYFNGPLRALPRVMRRVFDFLLDTPPCHHHQRQRNHQRCTNSSRSVAIQRELLIIECVALHQETYRRLREADEQPVATPH